jgi:predicted MFS family arabinose efflux permease
LTGEQPDTAAASAPSGAADLLVRTRWYTLWLLVAVYIFNFIDRQVVSILQDPIKHELGLNDTQLGLLTGFSFAVFYVTLGIPIAWLADRWSRKHIIGIAIAVWSVMTALCGRATSYPMLFLFRVGVGIGEAGLSPPAQSLISDYFPRERRATALAIYTLGIPIGGVLGVLLGGWLNQFFGWRNAFLAVGLPGLVLSFLVFTTLKEPKRGAMERAATVAPARSLPTVIRTLWDMRAFRHLALGGSLHAVVTYAQLNWNPPFYGRVHGLSTGEIGSWLALIGVMGGIGTYLGGALADKLAKRDVRWLMWLPGLAVLACTPLFVAQYWAPSVRLSILFALFPALLTTFDLGPFFGTAQSLVVPRMRATATAILILIISVLGLGIGPVLVGRMSDFFANGLGFGTHSLRYAIPIILLVNLWSAYHYFCAARYLKADLARTEH